MNRDTAYLRHIRECIRRIEENVAGGREHFVASHTIQDAVLRNLHTMAEATQRLSDAAKARRPEIEWRTIGAFRNVLVHDYLGVDLERIWQIVHRDVPGLKRAIIAMLDEIA
ncbi:MAG TPA: HepT-like ribonuclease domain-containing protein [Thermoleophilia bacterium]|nr:HepT-like ribonuclease domain-containing protein [Thermoleophilia bacterium]